MTDMLRRAAGRAGAVNAPAPPFARVVSLKEWTKLRGLSLSTARRLIARGKLRAIRLSERRLGITEESDREFLTAAAGED
jgi:hypothetical protein